MSLLGNYSVLHKSPAKYLTGTVGFGDRSNFNKPGMMRNRGSSTAWLYDAQPSGFYAGRAYLPPVRAGRLVARDAIKIEAIASGALGLPAAGVANFSINAFAFGGLISGGVANASFSINAAGSVAGLVSGQASSLIAVLASAQAGASAFCVANSTLSVSAYCQPYGLGLMRASTVDSSVLTPAGIAAAVWAYFNRTLTSGGGGSGGLTLDQEKMLRELFEIHGLDPAKPLSVSAASRTAGAINQTLTDSAGTTTVQRNP